MSARFAVALVLGLFAAAPLSLTASAAAAHEYKIGELTIEHPWARASAGNAKTGAVFMTIVNTVGGSDRLLSASTPIAATAELHTHLMDSDGVMKMRQVEAVELAPGATTKLAPGGYHVMLMGLTERLLEDTTFPLTLRFERAGELTVDVVVEPVAALEGSHDDAPESGHGHGTGN
jgi:copper(I)-binding protein